MTGLLQFFVVRVWKKRAFLSVSALVLPSQRLQLEALTYSRWPRENKEGLSVKSKVLLRNFCKEEVTHYYRPHYKHH